MADNKSEREVIKTGVREVDEKLGGGIPVGSLGLIEGQSDAGKSVLCQHLVYGALTCSEMSAALSLEAFDFFLTDRLRIYPLTLSGDVNDTVKRFRILTRHFSELPKRFRLVIIDSITLLVAHSDPIVNIDFFSACKKLCDQGRSIFVVAHSYAFDEELLSRSRSLCDAHFRIRLEQVGDRLVKIMEVLKVRGADRPTGDVVSFEVEPKIGMRIIPLSKAQV